MLDRTSPGSGAGPGDALRGLAPAVAAALAALVALAAPGVAPGAEAPPGGAGRLSTPEVGYWAFARHPGPIRIAPSVSSRPFASTHLQTELKAPEVYFVLSREIDETGRSWLQVVVPMRPNGRTGWVAEDALGALHANYSRLTIDLGRHRASLSTSGTTVWSAPVGIGKRATPTPRGVFYVRERLRLGRGGVYGSFAFGTSAYSNRLTDWPGGGVIGIHGTNVPKLIPGNISHGCVRLRNADVNDLRRLMSLGTRVKIR